MQDLNNIKKKISQMSKLALKMWKTTHRTFLEHNADLISEVLEDENKLNELEKEITSDLVRLGREFSDKGDKAEFAIYADIVGDLELIGDYCKDILERVQIKIEEKLLFSEEAVKEYEILYRKTEDVMSEIVCAFENEDFNLVKSVLRKEEHIDTLVDELRQRHNQRLLTGACIPIACNMYLNMLDFTAAVYYHTKKIAKNLLKIKS
ncbi:MAG: hypothetical protein NC923_01030 [Candidatus Omnitrophica bacterium]|nr:hypothetical protein [Candidatus Omnitrophota bacterium]